MLKLSDPVQNIPLIGKQKSELLSKLGITTVKDFLFHFPFRYDDYTQLKTINLLEVGERAVILAQVENLHSQRTKRGKFFISAELRDKTGKISAVWWNQPWIKNSLKETGIYIFAGKVQFFDRQRILSNPNFADNEQSKIHTAGLVPIYPETKGISSKWLRSRMNYCLQENSLAEGELDCLENFNELFREKYKLILFPKALAGIHFPQDQETLERARQRLAFDEMFEINLKTIVQRKEWIKNHESIYQLKLSEKTPIIQKFIHKIPFELTNAQKRVTKEILQDLQKEVPMNRLVQGDVGSGKTIVAAIVAYATFLSGEQTVFLTPTEILAKQHYENLQELFQNLSLKIGLMTSKEKQQEYQQTPIIVGTHALLYNLEERNTPGLLIIDEEHRFGVKQREKLLNSNQRKIPHCLSLTATPIPRSAALTLYGNLDLSIIDEMPPGRKQTKTWIVPPEKKNKALLWITQQIIENKQQVFYVCPFIETSDYENLQEVASAKEIFHKLKKKMPQVKIDIMHGQMKSEEKQEVVQHFREKKIDLLVSTPVIEVGIDIPQANIIVIENAERFGLASLHQLRGRVGRGGEQSFCLLFSDHPAEQKRLNALKKHHLGIRLAEIDMKTRGPGEIWGNRQHGFWELKIASLSDQKLISITRNAVLEYLENENFRRDS